MSSPADDETLLAELTRALEQDVVPDHRREAAYAAFSWRTIDEELLTLTHDSLDQAHAAVRGAAGVRTLAFEGEGVSLEIEVDGDRLVGMVLPAEVVPDVAEVTVETPDGAAWSGPVDESGVFTAPAPPGPVRLGIRRVGNSVQTPWILLDRSPDHGSDDNGPA